MHTPFNCKGEICYFVIILYTIWWTAFYYLTCVFQFKSHWRTLSANPVVMRVTICISFIQLNTVCFYNLCLCILHWLKNILLLSFFLSMHCLSSEENDVLLSLVCPHYQLRLFIMHFTQPWKELMQTPPCCCLPCLHICILCAKRCHYFSPSTHVISCKFLSVYKKRFILL